MSIYDFITNFWFRNEYDQCSLSEVALYFCLLHEANRQHWASPFRASTQILIARLGTSNQNIMKAHEGLMRRGLITYSKGEGKGKPALYTLNLNTSENVVQPRPLTQTLTQEMTSSLTQVVTEALTPALPHFKKKDKDTIHVEKKDTSITHPSSQQKVLLTLDDLQTKLLDDAEWQAGLSKRLAAVGIPLSGEALRGKIIEFFDDQRGRNVTHKEETDCRSYVFNWIKYHTKTNNYGQKGRNDSKVGRAEISDNRPQDYQGAC
jgi:hypothetical protein